MIWQNINKKRKKVLLREERNQERYNIYQLSALNQPLSLLFDDKIILRMVSENYLEMLGIGSKSILDQSIHTLARYLQIDKRSLNLIIAEINEVLRGNATTSKHSILEKLFPSRDNINLRVFTSKVVQEEHSYCCLSAIQYEGPSLLEERATHLEKVKYALNSITDLALHDINNKVTVIGTAVDLFLETNDHTILHKLYKTVNAINIQIDTIRKVKANILHKKNLERINLGKFFEDLSEYYKDNIRVKIQPVNKDTYVLSNELLSFIIENLINNVLIHSKTNEIVLNAHLNEDDTCTIEVKDNGIGIPERYQKVLFNEKLSISPTTKQEIGLSIIKNIIEIYGGQINYKPNKPTGSIFTITLPAATTKIKEGAEEIKN